MVDPFRSPTGGVKALLLLFFPIAITTFSNCLFLFVEKILLSRLSMLEMEAAVNAAYALQIFQASTVALALSAPVYLARCWAGKEWKAIGPGVWQFIWFCLLSMVITVPTGIFYGHFYFRGTEIENIVFPYYYFLLGLNFLFPLITSLTSFYISQGKTRLVLWATLSSQIIKIGLAYLLILGWKEWIPGIGLLGGPISTLIAQAGLCFVLLGVFLNQEHAEIFNSRVWHFRPTLFWECIKPGFLRAICRVLTLLSWASIAHLMTAKGGDYLLVLSIGGVLFFFFPFISDAIFQAQTTIVSQILGAQHYFLLNRAFHSATLLVLVLIGILAIPCLVFPSFTFQYLFPSITLDVTVLRKIFFGSWLSFAFFTLAFVPISHVLAFKDANFFLFMGGMNWIYGYLLMYIAIDKIGIAADQFWLFLSIMHISQFILYYWRMRWIERKDIDLTDPSLKPLPT